MGERKTMDVSLPKETMDKIEIYVKQGRFKSVEAFLEQATVLLIYAEENKDLFTQAMGN